MSSIKQRTIYASFPLLLFLSALITANLTAASPSQHFAIPLPNPPRETTGQVALMYSQLLQQSRIRPPGLVLVINLEYEQEQANPLTIQNVYGMNGYAPRFSDNPVRDPSLPTYTLQVRNSSNELLYSLPFQVYTTLMYDTVSPDNELTGGQQVSKRVDFTLVIPWVANGANLLIIDPRNNQIAQAALTETRFLNNSPDFFSILPDSDQPANPDTTYFNITFISDHYTQSQLTQFHNDVTRFQNHLTSTYEPYKTRVSQLRFRYVDNTADLGCPTGGGYMECNDALVVQQVGATPWDKIVVVINTGNYGGGSRRGGSIVTSYNGLEWGQQVFSHELEHALAGLEDEYDYGITEPYTNQVDANCYAGLPPAAPWQNIVAPNSYRVVCARTNWYRSSETSLMQAIDTPYFNAVSQILINSALNTYVGPFTDTVAPTISITAPQNNSYVTGNVYLMTSSSDNNGVAWVDLFVDGTFTHTGYLLPYTFTWNSYQYSISPHTLQVRAHDAINNMGLSQMVTVIACPADANSDGIVTIIDFNMLRTEFGFPVCSPTNPCRSDFDGNNVVNSTDFVILKTRYGLSCRPTSTPTATPILTPTPNNTPSSTSTPTSTQTPTSTSIPTDTPAPTPTP